MMRIVINFSPLKKGGGQNVALNFLYAFNKMHVEDDYYFIVSRNTEIESFLLSNYGRNRVLSISQNPIIRIVNELTKCRLFFALNHIDVIYTYFGFGLFPKKIPQIMGSADSNLFFPNINFWSQYSGLRLLTKKLIDNYRIYGLRRCDGIVFETPLLESRCHDLFKVKAITKTISPSINIINDDTQYIIPKVKNCPKALLLCGWQLNKNIMLVPQIALELKKKGMPFQFLISAPLDGSIVQQEFCKIVKELNVEEYINIIGTIDKHFLASLYSQINVVVLLSKLESFSNNIIEAWSFQRALLVADEPWARGICKDGAYYVSRDNTEEISEALVQLSTDSDIYQHIVNKGSVLLKEYPTIEQRTIQELKFIKEVYERKH